MNKNYPVITIGRQFGSGGHEIGVRLAKKLGVPLYDKDLALLTAKNSEFSESFLVNHEEKAPSIWNAFTGGKTMTPYYQQPISDKIFLEQVKTIRKLAEEGPCIIVGRCADSILQDINPLNVFIYADIEKRIERKLRLLKENEGVEGEISQMQKEILAVDKKRAAYYNYYTDKKWGDKSSYDLMINTNHITIDGAVDSIMSFVENLNK